MFLFVKIKKFIKELTNNLEEEYRRMPLFKKVLTSIGTFFFFAGAFTLFILLPFVLPYLEKKYQITLYIRHIRDISCGIWSLGMLIFAYCFKKTIYRLSCIFLLFAFLALSMDGSPGLWIRGDIRISELILSHIAYLGFCILGFFVLRYHLENKKGLEPPLSGGTAWGIKLSSGLKYLFETLNLLVAFIYIISAAAFVKVYLDDSLRKIWPIFIMFFLLLIVFIVGYYVNTRYIFQGLLLPPDKMKKFLLIVHVLFYSFLFLGVFMSPSPKRVEYFPGLIAMIVMVAGISIFFMLSFLGTYYGSRIAKKQLTAVWNKRVKKD